MWGSALKLSSAKSICGLVSGVCALLNMFHQIDLKTQASRRIQRCLFPYLIYIFKENSNAKDFLIHDFRDKLTFLFLLFQFQSSMVTLSASWCEAYISAINTF